MPRQKTVPGSVADSKGVARINFEIPAETFDRLRILPWGFRTMLMRILLEKVADALDKYGEIVVGALLSGEFTIEYSPGGHRLTSPVLQENEHGDPS